LTKKNGREGRGNGPQRNDRKEERGEEEPSGSSWPGHPGRGRGKADRGEERREEGTEPDKLVRLTWGYLSMKKVVRETNGGPGGRCGGGLSQGESEKPQGGRVGQG